MFRFVHAADLHLDSPLKGLDLKDDAPRESIREAPRRALEALVQLCLSEKVAFLLLAGDIYDGDWKDAATGQFFCGQMRLLGDIPVVMIRGNHDAANKMSRTLPLPNNVHMLGESAAETFRLEQLQVAIHGRSFKDQEMRENLARDYPEPIPGWFNIGLLHTSLAGSNTGHDTYAPCSEEQLVNKGYDYWALGHIHKREIVRPSSPAIVFPGNIQGRHVRETGEKGAYLVEAKDGGDVALQFRRLDLVRWEVIEHLAALDADCDGVLNGAVDAVRDLAETEENRLLVVRYRISGRTQANDALQARASSDTSDTFREMLQNEYGDRVWLESVRFNTESPLADMPAEIDDAVSELRTVVTEFAHDPETLKAVAESLMPLFDKLPSALKSGDEPLRVTDPAWLADLLIRVLPLLADAAKGTRP